MRVSNRDLAMNPLVANSATLGDRSETSDEAARGSTLRSSLRRRSTGNLGDSAVAAGIDAPDGPGG
jgi:hypothetical protein